MNSRAFDKALLQPLTLLSSQGFDFMIILFCCLRLNRSVLSEQVLSWFLCHTAALIYKDQREAERDNGKRLPWDSGQAAVKWSYRVDSVIVTQCVMEEQVKVSQSMHCRCSEPLWDPLWLVIEFQTGFVYMICSSVLCLTATLDALTPN